MNAHADKTAETKSRSLANGSPKRQGKKGAAVQLADNRPEAAALMKMQELANNSPRVSQLRSLQELATNSHQAKQATQFQALADPTAPLPIQQKTANANAQRAQDPLEDDELVHSKALIAQRQPNETDSKPRENNTGLPENLKAGTEALTGPSLDHLRIHYNAAQLNALTYVQGIDVHLAPGQERHLPQEAWHLVQQSQGRVRPTMQLKDGVPANDDAGLERKADVMGGRAAIVGPSGQLEERVKVTNPPTQQHFSGDQYKTGPMGFLPCHGSLQQIGYDYNAKSAPAQLLMKKMEMNKEDYQKKTRTTVFLYAELDNKPLGVFQSTPAGHAEENLITKIKEKNLKKGSLTIYLSTTPCSSTFCTRDDGKLGCQERLKILKNSGFSVVVKADHLYQPRSTGEGKGNSGFPMGFSAFSAAMNSDFSVSVSHLPKDFKDEKPMLMTGLVGPVAQLQPAQGHIVEVT
ncbi:MAG: hypothetical protein ACK41W_01580 [Cyanobacteriota bacterium]|jgi:hypothetical protein